jgi:membrane protein DedA with SNARE-associated domain
MDRPTREIVVILFAGTVCVLVMLAAAGAIIIELAAPSSDLSAAMGNIAQVVAVLVAAVVGYLAGARLGEHVPRHRPPTRERE